jgi:hypothetical protein
MACDFTKDTSEFVSMTGCVFAFKATAVKPDEAATLRPFFIVSRSSYHSRVHQN